MCFSWWIKADEISPMEFLTELVDVLAADKADIATERINWMLEQSSFNSDDPQHVEFSAAQLQGIMAIARLLSKCKNIKDTHDLINTLVTSLQSLLTSCNQESFPKWFTFEAASFFFTELNSYLVNIVESGQAGAAAFSSVIVSVIEKAVTSYGSNSSQELPSLLRAFFTALSYNCPALDASKVEQLSSCLLQEWILPFHGLSQENFQDNFNFADRSPSKDYIGSPSREILEYIGKPYHLMLKDGSPSEKLKIGSPAKNEGHSFSSVVSVNGNSVGKDNLDNSVLPHGSSNCKLSLQYMRELQEEDTINLEKQRFAFSLMLNVLDTVRTNHMANKEILFHQLMASAGQHLKAIPLILKLRKRDWPAEENVLKPKIHAELQICKAASSVYTKSFLSLKLEGRVVKNALRETLTILIDIPDACTVSPWRRLRSCEDLFACVLQNVLDIISLCGSQDLKAILLRLKSLIFATCAQADPWSSNRGPMFESVVKTASNIIQFIWNTDRAAVESFLLSLAANVRDVSGKEEKGKQVIATMHLNIIQFLADTVLLMHKPEIADMICPLFVESLEEGDASLPSRLRLQILESVARIATLGFEKSYREAVILLTRSYMDKLATVGSTQSRTLAPEATTERVETLPNAFLTIALGLSQPKLRADYRQRLLQLCSDVGLAAEAKSGKSGADLLGPLLPSVAEICSDLDILGVVEPTVLKLFRNLWFYIVLFGLAPPIQKVQVVSKNVSSSAPSVGSMSAVALQAVAGPYLWNTQWSAAVVRITQGTPPLVGSSLKWVEDELELSELHNPGSRRSNNNEKAASAQRAALCAALKDCIEATSISTMSGVKATYFLAVAFLEVLRLNYNGGVLRHSTDGEKLESALTCVFEYLEKPNLAPSIYQCLVAIVHRAFDASMAWLDDKERASGVEAEQRQTVIVTHACFLISKMSHRNESICDIACGLLDKIKHKYSQVLWNSSCLDILLHLVQTHSSPSMDPLRVASIQTLARKQIRSWIMRSLSLAPCTTQGLLQERIRALNTWSNGSYTSDLLPLLSDIKLDPSKTEKSGIIMIPATFAASIAAAGARGWMADMGTLEVLSNGIISANVKSSYIHINIGGLTFGLQDTTAGLLFGSKTDGVTGKASEVAVSMKHILKEKLIAHFLQLLQQFISKVEQGATIDTEAFRETCLRSTAFIVSELERSKHVEMAGFPKLIRLLCWCPAYICSPDSTSTGVFIWTWIVSAAPHLVSVLLAELVDAWLWTIETGRGLFASGPANSGPSGRLRPHLTPGEPVVVGNKHQIEGIIAHRLWLGFLFDQFEVVRHTSADQLSLIGRLLQGSVKTPEHFSSHPAATGTFFSLMLLGLKFCSSQSQTRSASALSISLLEDRIYRCALAWFSNEPEWYDCNVEGFSQEELQAVSLFAQHLSLDYPSTAIVGDRTNKLFTQEGENPSSINLCSQLNHSHPVWGTGDGHGAAREKRKQLLLMLCQHEVERLDTWANPLRESSPSKLRGINSERWIEYVKTAWSVDPRIALALPSRFPAVASLRVEVMSLVQAHISNMYDIPEALPYVITPKAAQENSPILQLLPHWAPCSITRALEFLSPVYKRHPRIMAYVLRVLESYPAECVTFFMPQLVQILRYDDGELVERYLVTAAQRSSLFAHLLIWQLQGEEPPSTEEFSKEQLQEDGAFHKIVLKVKDRIIKSFNTEALDLFEREFRFFEKVTNISGVLYPLPKDKRRAGIRRELEKIEVEGLDLYLPTAPTQLVRGIQLDSGIPLQSAAKVPIMVTFDVVDKNEPKVLKSQACIFKVGDDCRQDVLALQVIALLRDIFKAVGLNLYLFPYRVLPTGCGKGIVEVVPNTRSRNQMAETTDGGLYEIFQQDFGPVGSSQFEIARDNFIVSSAGYAVASLLIQPKDRHNGNLLFDNEGRLVHIDFGFILETSPGGNMRFESAQFKLSHEMTQLLDPSGVMKSETWNRFVGLCIKGYLAARKHMDSIIITVMLMVDSGLPCFSRGDPIGNLRKRFHPEMSEREAANFMIKTCEDAYNKWTTAGYDLIQYLQQGIEK